MSQPLDILKDKTFKKPGLAQKLREIFLGWERPLDCVQIEVTSVCAGGCLYCPHTTMKNGWKSRHMAPDILARLWPLLQRSTRAHLQGWGEPLLHPNFFDFAAFALKAGCQVSTTTCGLKMDEQTAIGLAESGMDLIAFSLAGTDEESNAIRRHISFKRVCESIKMLRSVLGSHKSRMEIHLAYILLADRMEAVLGLPDLMNRLDIDMTVVSTLDFPAMAGYENMAITAGETDKIAKARGLLEKAAQEAEKTGRLIHFALPGKEPVAQAGGCRENISRTLYVDAEGRISPCVYVNIPHSETSGLYYGNALEREPLEVWHGPEFAAFREGLAHNNPQGLCKTCPKRFELSE